MLWLKLEFKLLFAGWSGKLSLLIIMICALLAMLIGEQNHHQLRQDQDNQKALFEQQMEAFKQQEPLPSAGHLGYYVFGPTQWQLSRWSILFNGQSQTAYAAMPVRALALQGQIHNREILNPSQQKAGQLDMGFVLIYLLPLVLGILSINLLSDERQAGRWRMLSGLYRGGARLLIVRLTIIVVTLLTLNYLILIGAAFWLQLPFNSALLWLMAALALYLFFWALMIGLIISLAKSSIFNTLSFMTLWLTICILLPAAIALHLDQRYQQHPELTATLEQRMIMNNGWDQDQQIAMQGFKATYPQYQSYTLPPGSGSWHWYYAQQQQSDQAVQSHWQAHIKQQQQRTTSLKQLSWLSPSLMLQLAVNRLAGSGNEQHQHYIQQVAGYHQQISQFLYPFLYGDQTITPASMDNYPRFKPVDKPTAPSFTTLGLIALILLGAMLVILKRFRRVPLV